MKEIAQKLHQPVFRIRNGKNVVSCVCRPAYGRHTRTLNESGDSEYYWPMNWPKGDTWQQVYNRPENHNEPFTVEWVIR